MGGHAFLHRDEERNYSRMSSLENIPVLYEDDHLLAICKPAGLSSESGKASHPSAEANAQAYVREVTGRRRVYVRVVHRLDRVSSGVLLLAKSKEGLHLLMQQFEARAVQKTYVAEVAGVPPALGGELTHYLARSADGRAALVRSVPFEGSQQALCSYRVVEQREGRTRLELLPRTGRFHQLRAQLAQIGCPIVGDVRYGGPAWRPNAIRLHALRLQVQHPFEGRMLLIEAPLPEDWIWP